MYTYVSLLLLLPFQCKNKNWMQVKISLKQRNRTIKLTVYKAGKCVN